MEKSISRDRSSVLELHRLLRFTRYAKYVPLKPLLCFRLDPVDHASKQSEQSACIAETRLLQQFRHTFMSQPQVGSVFHGNIGQ